MLTTASEVNRRALRDALGFPVIMLIAGMMGFGSLARESGLEIGIAVMATVGIWGLPGQVALAELFAAGVPAVLIILAVSLANARFLPMAVSFMPLIRGNVGKSGILFLLVQLLSINSWAAGLKAFPDIAPHHRRRYYVVFALVCMTAGVIGTAIGFLSVAAMPRPVALSLIFLNPLFFAVLLAGSQGRHAVSALIAGAALGPLFHLMSPDWGLMITGVVAGTFAWWLSDRAGSASAES